MLSTTEHSRDRAGYKYIYPVISRRSGGLSVGINLNTNNACNWRCIYCQVPNLTRGSAPPVNLKKLQRELGEFLKDIALYDIGKKLQQYNIPTIIIAGKEYGTGSSRDWAAKGPALLGVRVVIAESFERIHRSNLIGMGIIPCEFMDGENFQTLGLTGYEEYEISDLDGKISPGSKKTVIVRNDQSEVKKFEVLLRIDTEIESDYYEHGGLLPYVLRQMISEDQEVH